MNRGTFTERLPSMAHQARHFELTKNKRQYGNVADMGTGKSKMLIDVVSHLFLNGHVNALLVIGNSGSYATWITEHLPTHVPKEVRYSAARWSSKLGVRALREFDQLIARPGTRTDLLVVVANVEALVFPRSFDRLYQFVKSHRTLTAIDESSTIKNPTSARTKAAFMLRDVSVGRRFLTGSPIDNRPTDLWAQLEFLQQGLSGHRSYYSFKNTYAETTPIYKHLDPRQRAINLAEVSRMLPRLTSAADEVGRNLLTQAINRLRRYQPQDYPIVKSLLLDLEPHLHDDYLYNRLMQLSLGRVQKVSGYKNRDAFRALVDRTCFVVRAEDCLDLPEKIYQTRDVELTDEQRRVYRDLREEALAYLDEQTTVTTTMVLTRTLRLHQVACGFVKDDDGVERDLPSRRIDVLLEALEEYRGSALIYVDYRRSLARVVEALRREYDDGLTYAYYGDTSEANRREAVTAVQEGRCRWFVTNKTGAYGLNLQRLDSLFFFANDHTFDAEPRNQVEKRLHRIGRERTRPVLYVDLVARGTVDERILEVLRGKRALSEDLIRSNWRELF
jgi:SNF2 family DNA or RNA helicase